MKEIEVKILEINPATIRKELKKNKAEFVRRVLQTSAFYENQYTRKNEVIVRARSEGKGAKLTIKSGFKIVNNHKTVDEYESEFDSLNTLETILGSVGLKQVKFLEMKREYWKLHGCSVEICTLPKIPTYIEIEGHEKNIAKVAKAFGYSNRDYFPKMILKYYGITDKILKFK